MNKMLQSLAVFLLLVSVVRADDMNTGIVYGDKHAFALTAPKGWVLDNSSGVSQGLHAVFYPEGSSWAHGSTVMYANVAVLDSIDVDFNSVLAYDTTTFRKESPRIVIAEKETILTKSKSPARVFYFSNDIRGNYEAVGYISEKTAVVMITISSRKKKEFDKYLPSFYDLVTSYFWMTDKVNDNTRH